MIYENAQTTRFKERMRDSLHHEVLHSRSVKVGKNDHAYTSGDRDGMLYFIVSGQVKLLVSSPEGKECLLAVHTEGDIFGELCLSGSSPRLETAVAMGDTILKRIPYAQFIACLSRDSLFEGFIQYLASRIADQQRIIAGLVTVDSEQRLGQTLLHLARTLGKKDPRSIRLEVKISHEELSEMVGTTRPRVSLFMKRFRSLGLIELNAARQLIIKEDRLTAYLEARSPAIGHAAPAPPRPPERHTRLSTIGPRGDVTRGQVDGRGDENAVVASHSRQLKENQ